MDLVSKLFPSIAKEGFSFERLGSDLENLFWGRSISISDKPIGELGRANTPSTNVSQSNKPLQSRQASVSTNKSSESNSYKIDAKLDAEQCAQLQKEYQDFQKEKTEETQSIHESSAGTLLAGAIHSNSTLGADLPRLALDIGSKHFDYGVGKANEKGQLETKDLPDRAEAIVDLLTEVCTKSAQLEGINPREAPAFAQSSAQFWATSLSGWMGQGLMLELNKLNNSGQGLLPPGLSIIDQGGEEAQPRIKMVGVILEDGTPAVKISAITTGPIKIVHADEAFLHGNFGTIEYGVDIICYPPAGDELRFEVVGGYTKADITLPAAK